MDKLPKMVDMALPPMPDIGGMPMAVNLSVGPQYPYGLCLSLGKMELEKLGLDSDCEVGDYLHMHCLAKVTSVSETESSCRVELQITAIAAEDEDEENEEEEESAPFKAKNPYKK